MAARRRRPTWVAPARALVIGPVGIEQIPTIIDMRRTLVNQGGVDPVLQQTRQNFAMQGKCVADRAAGAR
jgi:hypothetical protein